MQNNTVEPLNLRQLPSKEQQQFENATATTRFVAGVGLSVAEFCCSYEPRTTIQIAADNEKIMNRHVAALQAGLAGPSLSPAQRQRYIQASVQLENEWEAASRGYQPPTTAFLEHAAALPEYEEVHAMVHADNVAQLAPITAEWVSDLANSALTLTETQASASMVAQVASRAETNTVRSARPSIASQRRRRGSGAPATPASDDIYGTFIQAYRQLVNGLSCPPATLMPSFPDRVEFDFAAFRSRVNEAHRHGTIAPEFNGLLQHLRGEEATLQLLAHDLAYLRPDHAMILRLAIRRNMHGESRTNYDTRYSVRAQDLGDSAGYFLTPSDTSKVSIILFRGTSATDGTGIISDTERAGIGASVFRAAERPVADFVGRELQKNAAKSFCVGGHSLGGALAQRCFAHLAPELQGRSKLFGFSPAGIDSIDHFQPGDDCGQVQLFWHEDDIVHHAGKAHLPGQVYEFVYPLKRRMPDCHTMPLLVLHDLMQLTADLGYRRLSTHGGQSANNPRINLAEEVRSRLGIDRAIHSVFERVIIR